MHWEELAGAVENQCSGKFIQAERPLLVLVQICVVPSTPAQAPGRSSALCYPQCGFRSPSDSSQPTVEPVSWKTPCVVWG